ncbi:hypothetical protein ATCC90586_003121 [Pythium insidiosum]|nr:hypothetical protein ATCC90586_003121 [Pythium insidiosum]
MAPSRVSDWAIIAVLKCLVAVFYLLEFLTTFLLGLLHLYLCLPMARTTIKQMGLEDAPLRTDACALLLVAGCFLVEFGRHFDVAFRIREFVETALQTYQLYNLSRTIPSPWVNHLAVGVVVFNCFGVYVLELSSCISDRRRRVVHVLLDMGLDLFSAVGVPFCIMIPYLLTLDFATASVSWSQVFDDIWFSSGISAAQLVLITTPLDFVATLVPHLMVLGTLSTLSNIALRSKASFKSPDPIVQVNCHREGISGNADDLEARLRLVDSTLLSKLVFSHCPALEIPPIINTFSRHAVLFVMYHTWILGAAFFLVMWAYSALSVVDLVFRPSESSLPSTVKLFLLGLALYYAWHALIVGPTQPVWPAVRDFVRRTLTRSPYFRRHLTIFEDREAESLQDPTCPMIDARQRAMFAFHPHGITCCGFSVNGAHSERFRNADARWLVAENLFWFPVLRDILRWHGFSDVSKSTFERIMASGDNVCLIPGGFEEATIFRHNRHRVYLRRRAGFIKLALQHGYTVFPAYTFGEEATYHTFHYALRLRLWLNQWKIPAVAFLGRLGCALMPRPNVDLVTVVGKGIKLPKIEQPTREDVSKYHAQYVAALETLFERYKARFASNPNAKLEIF